MGWWAKNKIVGCDKNYGKIMGGIANSEHLSILFKVVRKRSLIGNV